MPMTKSLWMLAAGVALFLTACPEQQTLVPPDATIMTQDAGTGQDDASRGFPDTGIGQPGLRVTRVEPGHGPFTGGNSAMVRGTGFAEGAAVTVGGRMVQPPDVELVDGNRLAIVLPAGEPGPADVSVTVGDEEVTLDDGYTYDSVAFEPTRGAISGGTLVTFDSNGSSFEEGMEVFFGRLPCRDVTVVSETRMTCRTPPSNAEGDVDVALLYPEGDDLELDDAFEYFNSADPFNGGLGGGPIMGSINLTVINSQTGTPVPDAFAMVGNDPSTTHQGTTNVMGQLTFSGDDLFGRQTIHVAKHCFEKTSIVSFDAQDVTVFLVPWQDPMCGMPGGGGGGGGPGRSGAFIRGELLWPGDFGADDIVPWDNVPEARSEEVRVAYVFTTQRCPGDDLACRNPPPSVGDSIHRVLETNTGERGYPYQIFARPAAMAVYAVAGVEDASTGEFTPYVMGVARDVLAGPGETVDGVDMFMNIPLDRTLDVVLEDIPEAARLGPDRFQVRADVDLGGEGVIVRRFGGEAFDVVSRRTASGRFRFFAQPALLGNLSDGRYRIEAGWFTGDLNSQPETAVVRDGIVDRGEPVVMDEFLGIPQATSPAWGEQLPDDRVLRWEADGPDPDFHMVVLSGGDGNPAWRHFTPGSERSAPIPDLSEIPEIDDISSGNLAWMVFAIRIPGFEYDELSYGALNDRLWSAWAIDLYSAQLVQ